MHWPIPTLMRYKMLQTLCLNTVQNIRTLFYPTGCVFYDNIEIVILCEIKFNKENRKLEFVKI